MPQEKKKVKALPKSIRERKRYLLFEFEGVAGKTEVWRALEGELLSLYGSVGLARMNVRMVKFHPIEKRGVLVCSRGFERDLSAGLLFVRVLKMVPKRISGSIEGLNF